jgi:hypothetical protein
MTITFKGKRISHLAQALIDWYWGGATLVLFPLFAAMGWIYIFFPKQIVVQVEIAIFLAVSGIPLVLSIILAFIALPGRKPIPKRSQKPFKSHLKNTFRSIARLFIFCAIYVLLLVTIELSLLKIFNEAITDEQRLTLFWAILFTYGTVSFIKQGAYKRKKKKA